MRSVPYQMIFGRDEARVELSLQRSETAENKWVFDQLFVSKDQIETAFGAELDWRRMNDKKASRIVYSEPFDGFDRDAWPEMINWLSAHIQKLEKAFSVPLFRLNQQIRNHDNETGQFRAIQYVNPITLNSRQAGQETSHGQAKHLLPHFTETIHSLTLPC